jgi:hypothetical protein
MAQEITLSLGDDASLATRAMQLLVLITVLSLVPGLAIMITCFPFIVTVLAILRQAIGLQQSPPNMLIVSLALFLTWFVMEPVFPPAWPTGSAADRRRRRSGSRRRFAPRWSRSALHGRADRARHLRRAGRAAARPAGARRAPTRRCRCWCPPSCCPRSRGPSRSAS